jgi:cadmium resistance protein CadD (predicted permease)
VSVPAVIVVRKDSKFNFKSINDLVGKKVGIGDQYAVAEYIRKNNPRIIIEPMSDDETSLQQLVLGEIDASVMDVASLSHYLSKQVLSSVKIVGNTGFEYKLAFAVTKDKEILQSILDKGLQQISTADRNVITEKWITFQNEAGKNSVFLDYLKNNTSTLILYVLIIVVIILLIKKRKKHFSFHRRRKINAVNELKEEMLELEETSKDLKSELEGIEVLEEDIKEKIRKIGE